MNGIAGRVVLLAGATSEVGIRSAQAMSAAGARVIAVGRDHAKLVPLDNIDGVRTIVCDLADEAAVASLADDIHAAEGPIDGLIPLVGGWRGGGGIAGQTDADYRLLENAFTALRHTSRAFDADLRASSAGRLAVISSSAVERPLAGGANYAAVKAASEAWTRAVAHGFRKSARDSGEPLRAAAVILRVKALDPTLLADRLVSLWNEDAAALNDQTLDLDLDLDLP